MSYADREKKPAANPSSDDNGQVASGVRANQRNESNKSLKKRLGAGFRVDDDGVANNYPIETKMSEAEYPSPKQQKNYIFLGAAAILFTTLIVWIAFVVS